MKTIKFIICCCVMIVFATTAFAQDSEAEDLFKFEAGYPTSESSQALYDEMDYQRAVQAYIWATPMLNSMGSLMGTEAYLQSGRERKKIERLFGEVKRNLGLMRLRLRGLTGANDEFLLAATVQNLKRLASLAAILPPRPMTA